jgi:hypothetical protein
MANSFAKKATLTKQENAIFSSSSLPHNYKPSNDEEYMCDAQLSYFRQKLLTKN